jgi:G protein beta subunit-like protein
MYDLNSSNPNPVINYEGVSKNVTGVGFQEEGKWMYTGGEDCSARIWDLRYCGRVHNESVNHDSCYHYSLIDLIQGPVWRIIFTTNITTTCHWTVSSHFHLSPISTV